MRKSGEEREGESQALDRQTPLTKKCGGGRTIQAKTY